MIHCEHQVGFSAVETIRAKHSYERHCMENGVVVQEYPTDRGAFKANKFVSYIHETQKLLRYCGTNAHHQNGAAERAIQSISNMARAMILHSSILLFTDDAEKAPRKLAREFKRCYQC
jgi:hypothetical protein